MRDIKRRLGARQVDSDRLGSRKAKNPADLGASRRSASNSQRFRTVCLIYAPSNSRLLPASIEALQNPTELKGGSSRQIAIFQSLILCKGHSSSVNSDIPQV